mgnify:CR=1 FL=1
MDKEDKIFESRNYHSVLRYTFGDCFQCRSILDVGCAEGNALRILDGIVPTLVGLDVFRPFLQLGTQPKHSILINADARDLSKLFIPKSFDGILLSDVVEHFFRDDAERLLYDCETIGRKIVLLWIPIGSHPQTEDDRHMGNDFYQTHRTTWEPGDLERLGYKVCVWENYHHQQGKDHRTAFAWKEL